MPKMLSREGHRQRIRDSYLKNGIDSMQLHNIIELLLTYAIPRKDVKGIAYNLLNSFDNDINKVFSADIEEFVRIDGVGENAAVLIKLFSDIPKLFQNEKEKTTVNDYVSSKEFVSRRFSASDGEKTVLICTDNSDNVISCDTVLNGKLVLKELDFLKILDLLIKNKASSAIVVHISPESYMPTDNDIALAKHLKEILRPLGIGFNDMIIVGNDGSLSMSNDIRYLNCFLS